MTTLERARELGMALAASPEYLRLQQAKQLMLENIELTALIAEYNEKQEQLIDLMQSGEMDTKESAVILTNEIESLQKQLGDNAIFSELLVAQEAFSNLITAVNNEINACVGNTTEATASSACSGDCSQCHACKH